MSLMWGTKTSSTQDENNMLDLVEIGYFLKNFTTLILLVGSFYTQGKGQKSKNDEKHGKIVFSLNLYQSNHNILNFTLLKHPRFHELEYPLSYYYCSNTLFILTICSIILIQISCGVWHFLWTKFMDSQGKSQPGWRLILACKNIGFSTILRVCGGSSQNGIELGALFMNILPPPPILLKSGVELLKCYSQNLLFLQLNYIE